MLRTSSPSHGGRIHPRVNTRHSSSFFVKKHLEAYGELAVELDALRPDVLEQKIDAEITDVAAFNAQVHRQTDEKRELRETKQRILDVL